MKRFAIFCLAVSLTAFVSCSRDTDQSTVPYLIFGHSYGECLGGHCLDVFKLTDSALYEDKDDKFVSGDYRWYELSASKFSLARDLLKQTPEEIKYGVDQTFGCPDCHDQGALIVHYFDGVHLHEFLLDNDKSAIPVYLHSFTDQVNNTIRLINQ